MSVSSSGRQTSLKGYVDAVNVTDNQTAIVRMSSIATSSFLIQMGLEPVMQMTTRDRNRIAIQSDIFGATALGIKNMLCLTGDHHTFGNQVDAKNVHDLDSIQLIDCVRTMRDQGSAPGRRGEDRRRDQAFYRGRRKPLWRPLRIPGDPTGQKGGGGGRFHPDPVHLRYEPLQGMDENGPGPGTS